MIFRFRFVARPLALLAAVRLRERFL